MFQDTRAENLPFTQEKINTALASTVMVQECQAASGTIDEVSSDGSVLTISVPVVAAVFQSLPSAGKLRRKDSKDRDSMVLEQNYNRAFKRVHLCIRR